MKLEKVKHLLLVRNMANGIRFYQEVFGFQLELEGRMWSELKWGDLILALHGGRGRQRQPHRHQLSSGQHRRRLPDHPRARRPYRQSSGQAHGRTYRDGGVPRSRGE